MKKIILTLIFPVFLVGCAKHPENNEKVVVTQKRNLSELEKKVIQDSVVNQLKDPGSALFKMPQINVDGDPNAYCGLVNAKNSYGGYTGATPFLSSVSQVDGKVVSSSTILPGNTRYEMKAVIQQCADYGYIL